MNTSHNKNFSAIKSKTETIGKVLILAAQLDTARGENLKLQNILGKKLYYTKGGKWFYNIKGLKNKTIKELNTIAVEIESSINANN